MDSGPPVDVAESPHISKRNLAHRPSSTNIGCTIGQQADPPFHGQHSSGGSHQ